MIAVIDTVAARVVDIIEVSGLPTQLVVAGHGELLYCIDREDIVVLSTITNQIVDCVVMERELSCLSISRDGKQIFVADYDGGITVLRVGAADSTLAEILPDMLQLN